jgi:hypothetical protein
MPHRIYRVIQRMTGDVGQVPIPDMCDGVPGWITHADLGLVQTGDLVRR